MRENPAFDRLLAEPLTAAVGKTLIAVDYWILDCDGDTFRVDDPNSTGTASVCLSFVGTTIEITWGLERSLRAEEEAYHLQAAVLLDRGDALQRSQLLSHVAGSQAAPWAGVVGTALKGVEVYGPPDSPQAVHLSFPTGGIVLTTGDPGEHLSVGDGDEMLVFSDAQWREQSKPTRWTLLWAQAETHGRVLTAH